MLGHQNARQGHNEQLGVCLTDEKLRGKLGVYPEKYSHVYK
jgi:hypothetical protein